MTYYDDLPLKIVEVDLKGGALEENIRRDDISLVVEKPLEEEGVLS